MTTESLGVRLAASVREFFAREVAPLLERVAVLEARLADLTARLNTKDES